MDLDLTNKRVLITGATRGIGLATADAFLREGAIVFLNGHNKERLAKVCDELNAKYQNRVYSCFGDITSEDGVNEVIDVLSVETNFLDIAVMNLGNGKPNDKNFLNPKEWQRFYAINTLSAVSVLNRIHFFLKNSESSSVILLSSIVAKERMSAPVGYAAAKSAILTLNKYLVREWKKYNVRINCILPGNVYFTGGRWEELLNADKDGVTEYIQQNVPLKRFGKPEEIADAILFLASKRAGFINGATITIDGGQQCAI